MRAHGQPPQAYLWRKTRLIEAHARPSASGPCFRPTLQLERLQRLPAAPQVLSDSAHAAATAVRFVGGLQFRDHEADTVR